MPRGSAPQYDTLTPVLPRNNISSHVAGNVATRSTIKAVNSAAIISEPPGAVMAPEAYQTRRAGWRILSRRSSNSARPGPESLDELPSCRQGAEVARCS